MHHHSLFTLSLSSSSSSSSPQILNRRRKMQFKSLIRHSRAAPQLQGLSSSFLLHEPSFESFSKSCFVFRKSRSWLDLNISLKNHGGRVSTSCVSPSASQELIEFDLAEIGAENREIGSVPLVDLFEGAIEVREEEEIGVGVGVDDLGNQSIWKQVKEIVMFTGPATGLWICGPLMSLIDTVVIGQGSSIELAALGPATVLCDNMSYVFMFLSIVTSNLVATALARKDKKEVQHQISILLFVGLTCGLLMLFFTRFFGSWALSAFAGPKNAHMVPAANTYVQIRGLAWPAILVGWVAQSASLGIKDSWGPLKALAVASAISGIGDVVLCSFLGYGIAGAAWATMASQVVAAYMMIEALNKKGYNAFSILIPSYDELMMIFGIAAPVFITMMSKVAFYSLIIYFATSMGTNTVAAHQVMIQMYNMFTVWGEPLSQTAQSFMPELMYGPNRNLGKARTLLKSLMIIGAVLGLVLATIGASLTGFFPKMYTPDQNVIGEMHKVLIPYFISLAVTPCTLALEGTLLAGMDLKFVSLSMTGCFAMGALLLTFVSNNHYGLLGCWCALVGFQWGRFLLSLRRLLSPNGVLYSEESSHYQIGKRGVKLA